LPEIMQPTPTVNHELAHRTSGFASLVEGLDYAARGATGMNFFSPRGELVVALPYRELRGRARELARRLPAAGLNRGDRVAVVAET
jgi:fatty-acyl-CoA synthase